MAKLVSKKTTTTVTEEVELVPTAPGGNEKPSIYEGPGIWVLSWE
jgi:hypothetical protein